MAPAGCLSGQVVYYLLARLSFGQTNTFMKVNLQIAAKMPICKLSEIQLGA